MTSAVNEVAFKRQSHSRFSGIPRIVNYETGKAGAKARSLWRLEPLRIRWAALFLSFPFLPIWLSSSLILVFLRFSPYVRFPAALWPVCLFRFFIPPSFSFSSCSLSVTSLIPVTLHRRRHAFIPFALFQILCQLPHIMIFF